MIQPRLLINSRTVIWCQRDNLRGNPEVQQPHCDCHSQSTCSDLQNKCQRSMFLCEVFVQAEFCIPLSSQLRKQSENIMVWIIILFWSSRRMKTVLLPMKKNFCRHKDVCKCLHLSLMSSGVTPAPPLTISWSSQRQHDLPRLVCRNIHCSHYILETRLSLV